MTLINWTDPNPPKIKKCWNCSQVKPADTKHFHSASNTPDKLTWMCKPCYNNKVLAGPELLEVVK